MITETSIERMLGHLKLPADEPTRLRLYIWWGMFTAFHTYLLLALSAISALETEPRELTGGVAVFAIVFLGLSAVSFVVGLSAPWLASRLTPRWAAKPFFNFSCQLFFYNTTAIFALIIAVVVGRFQFVLWPTLFAFIGMVRIYPRKIQPRASAVGVTASDRVSGT